MINYFGNSVFIPERAIKKVATLLEENFSLLQQKLSLWDEPINLYLSGSLSRQEPSIKVIHDTVKLNSDIDWVAVVNQNCNTEEVKAIHHRLSTLLGESAVITTKADRLPYLQSCLARDLQLSLSSPIFETFSIEEILHIPVDSKHYYETMIHQISCYLFHPAFLTRQKGVYIRSDHSYHCIKLLLESLKLNLTPYKQSVILYKDLLDESLNDVIHQILPIQTVKQLIMEREIFGPGNDISIDVSHFIEKSCCSYFDLPVSESSRLVEVLEHQSTQEHGLIDTFQYVMLTIMISVNKPLKDRRLYNQIILKFLANHSETDFPSYEAIRVLELDDFKDITSGLELLSSYRNDYYKALYSKNVGGDFH